MRSLRDFIDIVSEKADPNRPASMKNINGMNVYTNDPAPAAPTGGAKPANPYTGADAARFAALTPQDQAWLTKGGGKPDLSDPYILQNAPNKGKPAAGGNLPAGSPSKPLTWTDSSGNPVRDGSGNPVQAGATTGGAAPAAPSGQAAQPASQTPAPVAQDDATGVDAAVAAQQAGQGPTDAEIAANNAALGDWNDQPSTSGQAAQPAAAPSGPPPGSVDDEGNLMPGFTKDENGNVVSAGDPNFVEPATQKLAQQGRQAAKEKEYAAAADQADADMGKAMAANAQAATTQAANGVNAQGQNVSIANADGSTTNPETGQVTPAQSGQAAQPASPANRDAMPFGKAFADAKAKGEKQFTWKGKQYAVQMAKPDQANKTAEVSKRTGVAMNSTAGAGRGTGGATAQQLAQAPKPATGQAAQPKPPVKESGYSELQRILSIVNYR